MSQSKDISSEQGKCNGNCSSKKANDSQENVKSDSGKTAKSFTELVQTTNATVKYTVHGQGNDGLPDIEMSACGGQPVPGDTAADKGAATCPALAESIVKESDLADIAKLIEKHERDNAEQKKQKEERKYADSRSSSNESVKETVQTQLNAVKNKECKAKEQPQVCCKTNGGTCAGLSCPAKK